MRAAKSKKMMLDWEQDIPYLAHSTTPYKALTISLPNWSRQPVGTAFDTTTSIKSGFEVKASSMVRTTRSSMLLGR
jgi:hypothetical protein